MSVRAHARAFVCVCVCSHGLSGVSIYCHGDPAQKRRTSNKHSKPIARWQAALVLTQLDAGRVFSTGQIIEVLDFNCTEKRAMASALGFEIHLGRVAPGVGALV